MIIKWLLRVTGLKRWLDRLDREWKGILCPKKESFSASFQLQYALKYIEDMTVP
jgi:hypothetical protein